MRHENQSILRDVANSIVIAPTSHTHIELATKIAERCLGERRVDLTHHHMDPRSFTVGEYCPRYSLDNGGLTSLRGKSVWIPLIPSPYKSSEELMMRTCMNARAAKEEGAESVQILATDFPGARQDRGPQEDDKAKGELNTVRLYADLLKCAGVDKVMTTHAHAKRMSAIFAVAYGLVPNRLLPDEAHDLPPQKLQFPHHVDTTNLDIQSLGKSVFKSISPHCLVADYLLHQSSLVGTPYLENDGSKLVLKIVDAGATPFGEGIARALYLDGVSTIYCRKAREKPNDPNNVDVEVEKVSKNFDTLEGKIEIIPDDGIDTAGTLLSSVRWSNGGNRCSETGNYYGIPEDRLVYATHAWFGGSSYLDYQARVAQELPLREFVGTNTRPYIGSDQYYKFKDHSSILRLAALWADAILATELGYDVTTRYQGFSCEEEQHEHLQDLYQVKRHSRHFMVDRVAEKREIFFKIR
jgi:phosphoribosylpyrophosphate synthetase